MAAVFAYGSLMYEPVLAALLQRAPVVRPALLRGYERRVITSRVYPAILPATASNSVVKGLLLEGLSEYECILLDDYEDASYQKRTVKVVPDDTGEEEAAECYVWNASTTMLSSELWDPEVHFLPHLEAYVEMSEGWRLEFEQGAGGGTRC